MTLRRSLLAVALSLVALPAVAQELAPAPRRDVPQAMASTKAASADPMDRASVVSLYRDLYVLVGTVQSGWNGSVATCTAGSTTTQFRDAVLDRVNVYRALAGLPGNIVQLTAAATQEAQAAALVFSASGRLSHSPDASYACYTSAAYSGAQTSNIALGLSGVSAIDAYMDDSGANNTAVGHRRWILYPPQVAMATGDVTSGTRSNALKVIGNSGPRPSTPNGVAWPPRGYVPYQLLPDASNRWSFSYPSAGFTNATVSLSVGGQSIPVTFETQAAGYGDNTIVFRPRLAASGVAGVSYARPAADTAYTVTVANVVVAGVARSFTYTVTVIDPDAAGGVPPAPETIFVNAFE